MKTNDDVVFDAEVLWSRSLTDAEKAQLAALAAMPDEAIDTSDLPPLTEAFFERAVRNPFLHRTRYRSPTPSS